MGDDSGFEVGALLRRARRLKRWSQRDLAARAGVRLATLADLESGATSDPRVSTLTALFGAMDCRLAVLSWAGCELPEHPTEGKRDYAGRRFPAHLDVYPVNNYLEPAFIDWWGWYEHWAHRSGACIPVLTFRRTRHPFYTPPVDPVSGELIDRFANSRWRTEQPFPRQNGRRDNNRRGARPAG